MERLLRESQLLLSTKKFVGCWKGATGMSGALTLETFFQTPLASRLYARVSTRKQGKQGWGREKGRARVNPITKWLAEGKPNRRGEEGGRGERARRNVPF